MLYALTLVPVGLLADRVDRPRLLSLGIALWSVLTMVASQAHGFGQLLATRVGFAAAQVRRLAAALLQRVPVRWVAGAATTAALRTCQCKGNTVMTSAPPPTTRVCNCTDLGSSVVASCCA